MRNALLRLIETLLFASRWVLVPFYAALCIGLGVLLIKAALHVEEMISHIWTQTETQAILGLLGLVDLTLTASLVVIVIFSGYENFVSRLDADTARPWPEWLGQIDFAGLKLKLLSAIVAIAAIQLLRFYLEVGFEDAKGLRWHALILIVFAVTGVLLALGDKIGEKPH